MNDKSIELNEFTIRRESGVYSADVLVWRQGEIRLTDEQRRQFGVLDYGQVLVRLGADGGMFDVVEVDRTGHSSDLDTLDRAIEAMKQARDALAALGHDNAGRCMVTGPSGRCQLATGHDDGHGFPPADDNLAEAGETLWQRFEIGRR